MYFLKGWNLLRTTTFSQKIKMLIKKGWGFLVPDLQGTRNNEKKCSLLNAVPPKLPLSSPFATKPESLSQYPFKQIAVPVTWTQLNPLEPRTGLGLVAK